jgi:hypothetical protein
VNQLEEEFFRQGDVERQTNMPISPLFDRAKQGITKSQVRFHDSNGIGDSAEVSAAVYCAVVACCSHAMGLLVSSAKQGILEREVDLLDVLLHVPESCTRC